VNIGVLKDVTRLCPICASATGEILHTQRFVLPEGHPQAACYDVVCCPSCGFVYADTATNQHDYEEFYARFSKYTDGKVSVGGGGTAEDVKRLGSTADNIAQFVLDKHARIADIGCATGGLLRALHRLGYTNLCGVDPSPSCAEQTAKVLGVDAYTGTISRIPAEVGQVDCLILSHVLEHIKDLRPALTYLRKFLKPNGCIYIETPNATRYADFVSAPFQDFSTEHINYFSLDSMTNLLHQCGFTSSKYGTKVILLAPDAPYPALFMFATPSDSTPALQKDEGLRTSIINYATVSRGIMNEIDARLRSVLAQTPEVLVWGTGQLVMKLLAETSLASAEIIAFVDSNPINQGMLLQGTPILAPSQVEPGAVPIIVASTTNYHDICETIRKLELPNPVIALRR